MNAIPAISSHALFLVLVEVAVLLVVARLLGELARRLGQPSVVGELLAGLVIGPSGFGYFFPGAFASLFPAEAAQFHLLELLGVLGMVLLMLLTGLETDVRRLRHLGSAALYSSVLGMVVPFALGFAFAWWLPESLCPPGTQRGLLAAFFATAMAISAMPVIAKILRDLDLLHRDIGILILTAGVVDDTVGWLGLSVIGSLAKGRFDKSHLVTTLGLTIGFVLVAGLVVYPLARWLFRVVGSRFLSAGNDLTLAVVLAFLAAAATEAIGVHPVFGAFVAGCVLRQVPSIEPASVARLEAVVIAIFAPLFFGIVGLKVDLPTFLGGSGPVLLIAAVGVASAGKLIGCTLGARLGGLGTWPALSIGVGMNARGAMELVVALVGLQLGILSPDLYAMLVVVAIATTLMAPVGLRYTLRRVPITDEERARILAP